MKHGALVQRRYSCSVYRESENGWPLEIIGSVWKYYGSTFRFRYDPVPGVKHYRNTIVGYYRNMKTTQEKRLSFSCDKKYVRSKRNFSNLTDDRCDVHHARREKGWKRTNKKRQWMKKGDVLYEKRKYDLD